jgi:hypothetical protein
MANLASAYAAVGRHEDALSMDERVMEFMCRTLPENHPDKGQRNVVYAIAYFAFDAINIFMTSRHGHEQSGGII